MLRSFVLVLALTAPFVNVVAIAGEGEDLFRPASLRDGERDASRFYIAGILGSSFATLTSPGFPSATAPVFTAGGAAGFAFEMLDRDWRLEVEGRARDPVSGTLPLPDGVSTSAFSATGGWSTTVNLWRDYDFTERLTAYVGGGIGGGGYQFGVNQQFPIQDLTVAGLGTGAGFAWQAGGGLAWALADRITLDLGYRFCEINGGNVVAQQSQTGVLIDTTRFSSTFSASELFFAIRIYEPFRRRR